MEEELPPPFDPPRSGVPHLRIVEVTPAEFAASVKEFYDELVKLGVEKGFAEKLTVAFTRRP